MTIGIAIFGPEAVKAALAGLAAVEAVGRGAIGGFVSLVAISDGALISASTQRGGSGAVFADGLPEAFRQAEMAALMSSGPDRPEPLIQFTPGDPEVGLVTGHRLPNMADAAGRVPNLAALEAMRGGAAPEEAVRLALASDPETDAGLIAMDLEGRIAVRNSGAVARRDDIGAALVTDEGTGMKIGVLHNSIFPCGALAGLAVSAALDSVAPMDAASAEAVLVGHAVTLGEARSLTISEDGAILAVTVPDPVWLGPAWEGSVIQHGDPVLCGGRRVGTVVREVYCRLEEGRIVGGRGSDRVAWRMDRNRG